MDDGGSAALLLRHDLFSLKASAVAVCAAAPSSHPACAGGSRGVHADRGLQNYWGQPGHASIRSATVQEAFLRRLLQRGDYRSVVTALKAALRRAGHSPSDAG